MLIARNQIVDSPLFRTPGMEQLSTCGARVRSELCGEEIFWMESL